MTREECGRWVSALIRDGNVEKFYYSTPWRRLRARVLSTHHYECQDCRKRGRYTRATVVHHERHLREYPQYALSETYEFQGAEHRNLTPLCASCHEARHPERNDKNRLQHITQVTAERW